MTFGAGTLMAAKTSSEYGTPPEGSRATRPKTRVRTSSVTIALISTHAACEQRIHLLTRFGGRHPVVVRAGVVALLRADEGQVLDTGNVRGTRTVQVTSGKALGIELQEVARGDHLASEFAVLALGAIAPVNLVRAGMRGDLEHPVPQVFGCVNGSGRAVGCGCHRSLSGINSEYSRRPGEWGLN